MRLVLDLLLELHDPVQQCLGSRRASGHVDVDGQVLVDALGDGVGVPVRAARVRARAEADDVLRLGHLLVHPDDRGDHLVHAGAGHDHQVGLARRGGNGITPKRMMSWRGIIDAAISIAQQARPNCSVQREYFRPQLRVGRSASAARSGREAPSDPSPAVCGPTRTRGRTPGSR